MTQPDEITKKCPFFRYSHNNGLKAFVDCNMDCCALEINIYESPCSMKSAGNSPNRSICKIDLQSKIKSLKELPRDTKVYLREHEKPEGTPSVSLEKWIGYVQGEMPFPEQNGNCSSSSI